MFGSGVFAAGYSLLAASQRIPLVVCILHGMLGVIMLMLAISAVPLVPVIQGIGVGPSRQDSSLGWMVACSLPLLLACIHRWLLRKRKESFENTK